MSNDPDKGRIVTFYSFKGGVGRTMALSNIAFLAAQNGRRVLVMDWDLEAPGLAYYFRGLMEGGDLKALKESPGILNLVWGWKNAIAEAKTRRETENVFRSYETGTEFHNVTHSILFDENLPHGGALDYIGAGSLTISTPEPMAYEDALAHFSWPEFFGEYAGGAMLESLREWAKDQYDYVFIDSRTGMADVAGICTMQIPDMVALCFILNRQSIDGVAKVAGAIRARREDEVYLRAIPMRAANAGAPLETDASARALQQLTKMGGFSSDALQEDFRNLSINAAQDLPYYETLAPLVAQDPELDYLTLNYLRAANQLLTETLEVPEFDEDWMAAIRRRLQPTHATIEYVTKLKGAEPSRALDELSRLIESAFEDEVDGADLDDDYVSALVDAALSLTDYSDNPTEAIEMLNRTVDLLRALTVEKPSKWKPLLISALERYLSELNFYLEPNEELALLEELDGLFATAQTAAARLKRISNRRRAARVYLNENDVDGANQTVGELNKLIRDMRESSAYQKLPAEQQEEVFLADIDVSMLRGDIHQVSDMLNKSVSEYYAGLKKIQFLTSSFRPEVLKFQYDLNSRLARIPNDVIDIEDAAEHALQAVRAVSWSGGANALVLHFADLVQVALRSKRDTEMAYQFAEAAFGEERRIPLQFANYYGRNPRIAANFLEILLELVQRILPNQQPRADILVRQISIIANLVYANLDRRKHAIGEKALVDVRELLAELGRIVRGAGLPFEPVAYAKPKRIRPPQ